MLGTLVLLRLCVELVVLVVLVLLGVVILLGIIAPPVGLNSMVGRTMPLSMARPLSSARFRAMNLSAVPCSRESLPLDSPEMPWLLTLMALDAGPSRLVTRPSSASPLPLECLTTVISLFRLTEKSMRLMVVKCVLCWANLWARLPTLSTVTTNYLFLCNARQALGVDSPIVAMTDVSSLAVMVNMRSTVMSVMIPSVLARRHGSRSRSSTSAPNGNIVRDVFVTLTMLLISLTSVDLPMTSVTSALCAVFTTWQVVNLPPCLPTVDVNIVSSMTRFTT